MYWDIPFYENKAKDDDPAMGVYCQEVSLQSILNFFEPAKNYTLEDLVAITAKKPNKGSWAFPYSIWLVDNGYEVKRITTVDYQQFAVRGLDYIKEAYGDEVANFQEKETDFELALETVNEYVEKVQLIQRKPLVKDIVNGMRKGYAAKPMVDLSVLNKCDDYEGHSVVVTGCEKDGLTIHDNGLPPVENRKVSKNKLQESMDAFGGELDLIKLT